MSEYISHSGGPGSIGALKPLAALSHAPTIGSNSPRRNIGNVTSRAHPMSQLSGGGCSCNSFGTEPSSDSNGQGSMPLGAKLLFGAIIVGVSYWLYTGMTEKPFDPYQSFKPDLKYPW